MTLHYFYKQYIADVCFIACYKDGDHSVLTVVSSHFRKYGHSDASNYVDIQEIPPFYTDRSFITDLT